MEKICSVKDCGIKLYAKNFCNKHYSRYRMYGNPNICLIGKEKK